MIKIVLSILAFASSFFLALLFWGLTEDSSKRVLTALFGSLTAVSILCAVASCLVCINTLLAI